MLFTDFYVSQAVCSTSRASLMIGIYAERVGIQGLYVQTICGQLTMMEDY